MSDCVYPCPCGYYGDSLKRCTFAHAMVTKYQKRISGPLLDRNDTAKPHRIGRAYKLRDIQNKRFSLNGSSDIIRNADMRVGEIRQFCGRR